MSPSIRSLLLGCLLCLASAASVSAGLLVSQMEDGDRIEVTYWSRGCFHNSKHYYELSRQEGEVIFREYAFTPEPENPHGKARKNSLGEVKLTDEEIVGLDNLFVHYRTKKDVTSTTQVKVVLEFFEGEKLIKKEVINDGSGEYQAEDQPTFLRFYTLRKRIAEEAGEL